MFLKQFSAVIFLVAFLLQTFSKCAIMVDYAVNNTSYVKNCINKTRPTLKCNGKCQVAKKMQQEEKKEQEHPDRKAEYKAETAFEKLYLVFYTNNIFGVQTKSLNGIYIGKVIKKPIYSIFQPPKQHTA